MVGPVAEGLGPVAEGLGPVAPGPAGRRFPPVGSVARSKSPPCQPGVSPAGCSGSVAWGEAPQNQTIRPQRAPPHRQQRQVQRHQRPPESGGDRPNFVPPGNQSMTSYSSGCIHFLSCFVSCTAHGQNATHFSVGTGVPDREKRGCRTTPEGTSAHHGRSLGRSSAASNPIGRDQVGWDRKEGSGLFASRPRRGVAHVTADKGGSDRVALGQMQQSGTVHRH